MGNAPMGKVALCDGRDRIQTQTSFATSFASSAAWSDLDLGDLNDEGVSGRCLEVSELGLYGEPFNPVLPQVRSKLLAVLGASPAAQVKEFKGCFAEDTNKTVWFKAGNMNEGIWFMKDGDEEFVFKLVKSVPQGLAQASETDQFVKLYNEIPEIINDLSVAFPVKILKIIGPGGVRTHDLHVMRRVPGRSFDAVIESYWKNGKQQELMVVFRRIGEFLRKFHERYGGRQHCDVGPQNIFYDEVTEQVAIVDLGMMGVSLMNSDVQAFSGYVKNLTSSYGREILKGVQYFEQGYYGSSSQQAATGGA